jgi:hypothetical protein
MIWPHVRHPPAGCSMLALRTHAGVILYDVREWPGQRHQPPRQLPAQVIRHLSARQHHTHHTSLTDPSTCEQANGAT